MKIKVIGQPLHIEPQGATSLALSHLGSHQSSGRIRAPFQVMESMMPTCMQNPTHAQNHYDSAKSRLKKSVLWPIFPAGLEIRPHPPKGGPPSRILSRVREGDDLWVPLLGLQILYASPRAAHPLTWPLTLGFYASALRGLLPLHGCRHGGRGGRCG